MEVLGACHSSTLQRLYAYELTTSSIKSMILPNRLMVLECKSIRDGRLLRDLIRINRNSLQRLCIGQEKQLVQQYSTRPTAGAAPAPLLSPLDPEILGELSNLRELDLCGLDVRSLFGLVPWRELTRLSLQSCTGSIELLRGICSIFEDTREPGQHGASSPPVQLKEFLFRTEAPVAALQETLKVFLGSFAGLETLSLLFENGSVLDRVSGLLCDHGPSLRTLVLEARVQPRESLALDPSRAFGSGGSSQELWQQAMTDICERCPNLVELGFTFPWEDELIRLRRTPLPTLAHLKTIHIRNLPETRALSQMGDYTIKEYAQKFTDWIFPSQIGGPRPTFGTLAIGPTVHDTRRALGRVKPSLPEFKRTHYFAIDFAKNRFSRWCSMISRVSEKVIEEERGQTPLGGVFEQVWLR